MLVLCVAHYLLLALSLYKKIIGNIVSIIKSIKWPKPKNQKMTSLINKIKMNYEHRKH